MKILSGVRELERVTTTVALSVSHVHGYAFPLLIDVIANLINKNYIAGLRVHSVQTVDLRNKLLLNGSNVFLEQDTKVFHKDECQRPGPNLRKIWTFIASPVVRI